MPTSFRTPVVRPARRCAPTAALGSGEEIVGEADRDDRRHARLERAHDPADEREAQAAVVGRERAERRA